MIVLNKTPYFAERSVSAIYQIAVAKAKPFQAHLSRVLNGYAAQKAINVPHPAITEPKTPNKCQQLRASLARN